MVSGQHPDPDHVIVHISDTHFIAGREPMYGVVDCDANLTALFDGFARSMIHPEAIVVTGDLADTGAPDAYRRLREIVEPRAAELGAEVVWVMGNHDDRGAFRAGLLDGAPTTEPVDRVHELGGLRVVVLDTTVPGEHYGELRQEQLDWLDGVLADPAADGTLLALHHPPVPNFVALHQLIELREQYRLAEVVAGTDVRAILGGHLHYSTASTFAGIPVSVASATCYTADLQVRYPELRGQDGGQSYNLVHVYPDRVMHSIVPLGQFPTVYELTDGEEVASLAVGPGRRAERPDLSLD